MEDLIRLFNCMNTLPWLGCLFYKGANLENIFSSLAARFFLQWGFSLRKEFALCREQILSFKRSQFKKERISFIGKVLYGGRKLFKM